MRHRNGEKPRGIATILKTARQFSRLDAFTWNKSADRRFRVATLVRRISLQRAGPAGGHEKTAVEIAAKANRIVTRNPNDLPAE